MNFNANDDFIKSFIDVQSLDELYSTKAHKIFYLYNIEFENIISEYDVLTQLYSDIVSEDLQLSQTLTSAKFSSNESVNSLNKLNENIESKELIRLQMAEYADRCTAILKEIQEFFEEIEQNGMKVYDVKAYYEFIKNKLIKREVKRISGIVNSNNQLGNQ